MFSQQQQIKKLYMTNSLNNQFQNAPFSHPPGYYQNSNFSNCSDYSPYVVNDNYSCYSNSTTASNNIKKRNLTEDFSSLLSNCMEELLPKIADSCAEIVYTKISEEINYQYREIEELKIILDKLSDNDIYQNVSLKNFSPVKKLKNITMHLDTVNKIVNSQIGLLKDQNETLLKQDLSNNLYDKIDEKLISLQETIEEERKISEKLNVNLKDRFVDFLGIKNLIDDRLSYIVNDLGLNPNSYNFSNIEGKNQINEFYNQIVDSINELADKLNMKTKIKKSFPNLEVHNSTDKDRIFVNSSSRFHCINSPSNNVRRVNINANCNLSLNMENSNTKPIERENDNKKRRGKIFHSFQKFSF